MGSQRLLLLPMLALGFMACQRPTRTGEIIDRYRGAQCVQPSFAKGVSPPTRGWDTALTLGDGSKVRIAGADMVGGAISVRYESDGQEVVAVQPGDYIYPSDVRVDAAADLLYVKARGAAAGIWKETWLYRYDLQHRRQVSKVLVEPTVLPPECPIPHHPDNR